MSEEQKKDEFAVVELKQDLNSITVGNLADLSNLVYGNLKERLADKEGPFATDPELCLEAYKVINKAVNDRLECKRRIVDTLIKARTVFNQPPAPPAENIVPPAVDSDVEPDQESVKNSAFA